MSAGRITVEPSALPPAQVAVLQRTRIPALPSVGAAWERVFKNVAKSLTSLEGIQRLSTRGVGLTTAFRSTAVGIIRGAGGLIAVGAVLRFTEHTIRRVMAQEQVPEIRKVNAAIFDLGGQMALVVERRILPWLRGLAVYVRRVTGIPRVYAATFRVATTGIRALYSLARRAATKAIERARGVRMKTTAGLERGGTRIRDTRFRQGFADGGVIFTLPGGATFTEPLNVIADDRVSTAALVAASSAAVRLAAQATPVFGPTLGAMVGIAQQVPGGMAALAEFRTANRELATALAQIENPAPPPMLLPDYGAMLEKFGADKLWREAVSGARNSVKSLDGAVNSLLNLWGTGIANYRKVLGETIQERLQAPLVATNALNEAIQLDLSLIPKITGQSISASKIAQRVEMALVGVIAAVLATTNAVAGVAKLIAGDYPGASAHFVAAGFYTAAAVLAGASAAGIFRAGRTQDIGDLGGVRSRGPREAELLLIVPGMTDTQRLQDMIVRSLNADNISGATYSDEAIAIGAARKPSLVKEIFRQTAYSKGTARQRIRKHLENDVVLGPLVRVGRKVESKVRREVKRFVKKLKKKLRF